MRLSPDVFWSMTPFEFAAAALPFVQTARPPGRAQLDRLMHAHPDTPKPKEAGHGR
jgi:uncharacterized phage protein (TIGR02216 family)